MNKLVLRLFVTGRTPRSDAAIANARWLCERRLNEAYDLVVVDVLEQPHAAETSHVLATPTLILDAPPPERRVIGDLSDPEKVLAGLGLIPRVTPVHRKAPA